MKKIKTSTHRIIDLNLGKDSSLSEFISDYRLAVKFYVNYLWNNKIITDVKDSKRIFDIKSDQLNCPMFISTKNIPYKTNLSGRALKAASTQACGIVQAAIEKRKRLIYVAGKLKSEKKRTRKISWHLRQAKLAIPITDNINPCLDSLTCKVEESHISHYDTIVTLSSIGKHYGKIIIPINKNKHSNKLAMNGKLLSSILLSPNNVYLRFQYEAPEIKKTGIEVGADSGINSVLTLSDRQQTKADIHGHTLNSILKKITRKKKGGKSFEKALAHRDNFIRWSINSINLKGISKIKLEKVSNFRRNKNVGKFLNYSSEALIREKLIDYAEDHGVHVILQNSAYRSQRCSNCGYVCRSNRKEKLFSCKHCLFQADADYNASCNHEQQLPSASLMRQRLDKNEEFIWKADGFFRLDGSEITVPDKKNKQYHKR